MQSRKMGTVLQHRFALKSGKELRTSFTGAYTEDCLHCQLGGNTDSSIKSERASGCGGNMAQHLNSRNPMNMGCHCGGIHHNRFAFQSE